MTKYRKKPVVIEAVQFTGHESLDVPTWFGAALVNGTMWYQGGDAPHLTIRTLEGDHRADVGDFIIQGVKGELYPCKPEIFAMTYELAEA